jgi:hypothetical protein
MGGLWPSMRRESARRVVVGVDTAAAEVEGVAAAEVEGVDAVGVAGVGVAGAIAIEGIGRIGSDFARRSARIELGAACAAQSEAVAVTRVI